MAGIAAVGVFLSAPGPAAASTYVRVDEVGYATASATRAYLLAGTPGRSARFTVRNGARAAVLSGKVGPRTRAWSRRFPTVRRIDFDRLQAPGTYTIEVSGPVRATSPPFRIAGAGELFGPMIADSRFFFAAQRDGADMGPAVLGRVYPFGSYNAVGEQVVQECGYSSGRHAWGLWGSGCEEEPATCPYAIDPANPADRWAMLVADAAIDLTYVENQRRVVQNAIEHGGGWVQIFWHRLCPDDCDEYSWPPAWLDQFVGWLEQQRAAGIVDIKSSQEVLNLPFHRAARGAHAAEKGEPAAQRELEEPGEGRRRAALLGAPGRGRVDARAR